MVTESLAELTVIGLTAALDASSAEDDDDELLLLQLEACWHQHQQRQALDTF